MCSNSGLNFLLFEHRRSTFSNSVFGEYIDFLSNNGFHCESRTTAKCRFCGWVVNLTEFEIGDDKYLHHDYCEYFRGADSLHDEHQTVPKSADLSDEDEVQGENELGRSVLVEEEGGDAPSFHLRTNKADPVPNTCSNPVRSRGLPSQNSLKSRRMAMHGCTSGINSEETLKMSMTVTCTPEVKIISFETPDTVCPGDVVEISVGSRSTVRIHVAPKVPCDVAGPTASALGSMKPTDEIRQKVGGSQVQDPGIHIDEISRYRENDETTPEVRYGTMLNSETRISRLPEDNLIVPQIGRPVNNAVSVASNMMVERRSVVDLQTNEVYLSGRIFTRQPESQEEGMTTQVSDGIPVGPNTPVLNRRSVTPCDPNGTCVLAL